MNLHTAKRTKKPGDRQKLPRSDLQTIAIRDFETLRAHMPAWEHLAWSVPNQFPTLLPAWVEASLRHGRRPTETWCCLFAYHQGSLVGVLPVLIRPHRLLGDEHPLLRSCDNHTPTGDILLMPEHAGYALQALLAALAEEVPNHLGLEFKTVRHNSPLLRELQGGIDGYLVRRTYREPCSFLDVRGDFDTYFAGLGKIRRNLRSFRRKLESRGKISVEIRTGDEAKAEFLQEFLALEASGWKGRIGTAWLNNPNSVAFHTALLNNFAAKGLLEWHIIRVDSHLVAADLAMRCGSSLLRWRYAFDEDFAECTPGSLLSEVTFKEAFSRPEIHEIHHMSLTEPDRFWRMSQDEYVTIHLVRQKLVPMTFHLPRIALRAAYETHVRPYIPGTVRNVRRKIGRRGDRKPRRAYAARPQSTDC